MRNTWGINIIVWIKCFVAKHQKKIQERYTWIMNKFLGKVSITIQITVSFALQNQLSLHVGRMFFIYCTLAKYCSTLTMFFTEPATVVLFCKTKTFTEIYYDIISRAFKSISFSFFIQKIWKTGITRFHHSFSSQVKLMLQF